MAEERRAVSSSVRIGLQTVLGVVIVAILAAAVVLFATPLFLVTDTSVEGIRVLTKEQVLQQAQIPMNTRMAELDTHAVSYTHLTLPTIYSV